MKGILSSDDILIELTCQLRALPENKDLDYKYKGPTLAIMHEIVLNEEKDAELVNNIEHYMTASAAPAFTPVNIVFDQAKRLIVSSEVAPRRDAWPEAYFSHENRPEMLRYHDTF